MKRIKYLLLLLTLCIATTTFGHQKQKMVTLSFKNVTVKTALKALKAQSGLSYWFDIKDVNLQKIISVNIKSKTVEDALNDILRSQNVRYRYQVTGDHIVISRASPTVEPKQDTVAPSGELRTINGTVTSADDGSPLPGVAVLVKGTTNGTSTDLNGKYSINVNPKKKNTLVYSFIGMRTQEIVVGKTNTINVVMRSTALAINEVVVTALGISRETKALGYATQEVGGDQISEVKSNNFINSLSGRVSGVDVRTSDNMGGSTNIVIRGYKSLTGNNQALFVVDGVPFTNETLNSSSQSEAGGGYDYGSTASDINPNDIKSVTILKGAAATALYGSRAANGVIIITTKSGSGNEYLKKNGLGISFYSNVTFGVIDKSTFPQYQTQYGAGYGPYYSGPFDGFGASSNPFLARAVINGKLSWVVPTTEDASFGAKFDPNLMVYQWDAFVPESPNYGKATPWVAAKNGPITFFNTAVTTSNTVAVSGISKNSTFRFSYTNFKQKGIMPNSSLKKNSFSINATHKLAKNLIISTDAHYVDQATIGRNGTGYSSSIMTSFRQWFEMNVDIKEMKALYNATGKNISWNETDPVHGNNAPIYWNNFYWQRYNDYENDSRGHIFGNVKVKWDITSYLSVVGFATLNTYTTLQEEHLAEGSVPSGFGIGGYTVPSGYSRKNINFTESNYNLMINFTKNLTDKLNLKAMAGGNIRRNDENMIYASTNGGLIVPGLNALNNSVSPPLAPQENATKIGVNSLFGDVSFGYNNLLYLDATLRGDRSSTLPIDNDTYLYPSVSGSFIFSKLLHLNWLPFAKVRLNYAEVGNDAPFASLYDTYSFPSPFGSIPMTQLSAYKNNPNLKPEQTKSTEAGLTANFVHNRLVFDLDVYRTNTINQIMPVSISRATGYDFKYVNAGTIRNQGIEINLYGIPIKTRNFSWNFNVNWSMNRNKVISLYQGAQNLVLNPYPAGGNVTIDAEVGHPYGVIEGTTYVYTNGQKTTSGGYYEISSTTNNVIGNMNPLWKGGMTNSFTYKNWTASFLIDISKGGSIWSLDQDNGGATGIYANSVGNNDLGNPKRDWVANGGGVIFKGVNPDGTPNTTRVEANDINSGGFAAYPNAAFVYDASYVKLKEAQVSYNFPKKVLKHIGISALSLGLVGSNLWIIFKNLPDADPEAGLGAGNTQGYQSGVMPTTRNFGFNLKVHF